MTTWLSIAWLVLQIVLEALRGERAKTVQELRYVKTELTARRKQAQAAADTAHLATDHDALADRLSEGDI